MFDFFSYWFPKYSRHVREKLRAEQADTILAGWETINKASPATEISKWVKESVQKLRESCNDELMAEIMTSCACEYPGAELSELKTLFARSGNIKEIHGLLEKKFRDFLLNSLKLDHETAESILDRGWGLAGILQDNKIIATKIPKSGFLKDYLEETDPVKRKELYCHCPLVRDLIRSGESIPDLYCYCGAGFYKKIWEEITGREVSLKILSSLFKGDDSCQFELTISG